MNCNNTIVDMQLGKTRPMTAKAKKTYIQSTKPS